MLATVIITAIHFSEERELAHIAERAQPWWLAIAIVLQALTYLAQGETWRVVTRAAGVAVPLRVAFKLSLAKLFIDQALPSAGISGTVVVARHLSSAAFRAPWSWLQLLSTASRTTLPTSSLLPSRCSLRSSVVTRVHSLWQRLSFS